MVAAWLCLAFMQQKNLIRPFNAQMSFYATMLVLTLLSNLFRRPTSQKTVQNFQSWLLILIFFSSLFISFKIPLNLSPFSTTVTAYAGGNLKQTLDVQAKLCSLRKINWARLQLPPDYDQVIQALKDQPLTSYITFPYDPLFYLIGNQPPLPYPNAYESAFIGAQTANINHLQSHQTQAVIYSFPETPIDWAPDYVRNLNFTRYVLTHFSPFQVVGRFTLLKLDSKGTVYNQGSQTSFPDLYDHFTQLNWGYLPISEGDQFSDRIILDGLTRGFYSNTDEANASLLASPLSTQDLYLILDYVSQATPAVGQVTFTDVNDQATTVTFGLKANRKPLLKLANLPLFFYGNRLQALTINPAPVSFWLVVNDKMRDTWQ